MNSGMRKGRNCILCGEESQGQYPYPSGEKYYSGSQTPPIYIELCDHHANNISCSSIDRMIRKRLRLTSRCFDLRGD